MNSNHSPEKLAVFIAQTLDGYIAGLDNDIGFLDKYYQENEDYGYSRFMHDVDAIIIGRKTFDKLQSFQMQHYYEGKPCYVITRTPRTNFQNFIFYSQDIQQLYNLMCDKYKRKFYIDGGAETIASFHKLGLIDSFTISILPEFLGNGIKLFPPSGLSSDQLNLEYCKQFDNGLIQLKYLTKPKN